MSIFLSNSVEDTRNFGKNFAKNIKKGQVFALNGEVGCGKTEFVRGVMEELSPQTTVSSPTFSVVNSYKCKNFTVYHFDFYRIKNIDELFEIGFEEYLSKDNVVFIEWADMFPQALSENAETLNFEAIGENERKITF